MGTIGVDLFFVLSGFLIGSLILKQIDAGKTDFKDFFYFWLRRWFKTLPNYYLILCINLILAIYVFDILPTDSWKYLLFIQNFSEQMPEFFTESWSLSIEEFSYIIGPLILLLLIRFFKVANRKLFFTSAMILIVLGYYLRYRFHILNGAMAMEDWSKGLRKVVIYRLDSIYYGFIGAYIARYLSTFWTRYRYHSVALGAIIFMTVHVLIFYKELTPINSPILFNIYYLPLLLISLLSIFPYCSTYKSSTSVLAKPITYISIISYAIYLVNYSIILLSLDFLFEIENFGNMQKLGLLVLFWASTWGLSHILYNYYERPIMAIREHPKIMAIFNVGR